MSLAFTGTRWMPISELGISQIYLSAQELEQEAEGFTMQRLCADPIRVFDFGNGRLTITTPPGHRRAFLALQAGMSAVPVIYDPDDYLRQEDLLPLLADDVLWSEKIGLHSVADLKDRVLSNEDFERLYIRRCERSNDMYMETNPAMLPVYAALRPDLHLYGISDDLKTLYFEDTQGVETALPVPERP